MGMGIRIRMGIREEEDKWYSLDQVPTTSHLVKTKVQNSYVLHKKK
jgi:hypothetical protein